MIYLVVWMVCWCIYMWCLEERIVILNLWLFRFLFLKCCVLCWFYCKKVVRRRVLLCLMIWFSCVLKIFFVVLWSLMKLKYFCLKWCVMWNILLMKKLMKVLLKRCLKVWSSVLLLSLCVLFMIWICLRIWNLICVSDLR